MGSFARKTSMTAMASLLLLSSTTVSVHGQLTIDTCPLLVWSDEFEANSLDDTKWTPQVGDGCDQAVDGSSDLCGWGNNELQVYTSSPGNIEVSNGSLKIIARQEDDGQYTSGRIRSLDKGDVDLTKPTYIEARIKLPRRAGVGLWPAFWMMPSDVTRLWPSGGEIDIMEFIGREPNYMQAYVHYGVEFGDKEEQGSPIKVPPVGQDDDDEYHIFAMIKTFERITFLIDGYPYITVTADDIEPKYTWPFDQPDEKYYFLLNVAIGGDWPGPPNQGTTVFPSSMEVDYIRVFDLSNGKVVPRMDGVRLVHPGTTQRYCVSRLGTSTTAGDGASWSVPQDASFELVDPSNPECILVTFGAQGGYVTATLPTLCLSGSDAASPTMTLKTPVEVQPYYGNDNDDSVPIVLPSLASGTDVDSLFDEYLGQAEIITVDDSTDVTDTSVTRNNIPVLEYTRSLDLYDYFAVANLQLTTELLDKYLTGMSKFFLTIQTTTSASCTLVYIQLEDSNLATPDNYPIGRHSRYQCLLEDTRDYQRVACDFVDQPDPSVQNVDRAVILIDPGLTRNDVYRFQSIESLSARCDPTVSTCERLQSNGPSTDNCRRRNKSEAGRCNDELNNDGDGYDGNLTTDCDDPQCFGIDPVCTSDVTPTNPPTDGVSPTDPPIEISTGSPAPTNYDDTKSPTSSPVTSSPTMTPAPSPDIFDGPAQCLANPACTELADDCCPTIDDVYLYCCFEDGAPGVEYGKEFALVTPQDPADEAMYMISTAPYFDPATAPDGTFPVISYVRDAMEVYDLVYYNTTSITDAGLFLNGEKKFFIDIYTEAPACTQIYLQLDSLPLAAAENYPIARYARFVAFTTKPGEWERLEFDLLDQPDPSVSNTAVNAIVLFFDPGTNNDDAYFYRNLDVSSKGCSSGCEDPSPKSCAALFVGETCDDDVDNDNDGLVDCEDYDCFDHPACVTQMTRSYRSASNFLQVESTTNDSQNSGARPVQNFTSSVGFVLIMLFVYAWAVLPFPF
mmetsp:Transcript_34873/g.84368  ORF Transcript_34873/g.84368 Transcript_34873/m.84368 type:complete len:1013 (+) Transcript_34873:288-3326(+)